MYKFRDTQILDQKAFVTGSYVLAYSQNCERQRSKGFDVRYYKSRSQVDPWHDSFDEYIDFAEKYEGLNALGNFPEADRVALTAWLSQQL